MINPIFQAFEKNHVWMEKSSPNTRLKQETAILHRQNHKDKSSLQWKPGWATLLLLIGISV